MRRRNRVSRARNCGESGLEAVSKVMLDLPGVPVVTHGPRGYRRPSPFFSYLPTVYLESVDARTAEGRAMQGSPPTPHSRPGHTVTRGWAFCLLSAEPALPVGGCTWRSSLSPTDTLGFGGQAGGRAFRDVRGYLPLLRASERNCDLFYGPQPSGLARGVRWRHSLWVEHGSA